MPNAQNKIERSGNIFRTNNSYHITQKTLSLEEFLSLVMAPTKTGLDVCLTKHKYQN